VKLQGDNKHYSKMMDESIRKAEKLEKTLQRISNLSSSIPTSGGKGGFFGGIVNAIASLRNLFSRSASTTSTNTGTGTGTGGKTRGSSEASMLLAQGKADAAKIEAAAKAAAITQEAAARAAATATKAAARAAATTQESAARAAATATKAAARAAATATKAAADAHATRVKAAADAHATRVKAAATAHATSVKAAATAHATRVRAAADAAAKRTVAAAKAYAAILTAAITASARATAIQAKTARDNLGHAERNRRSEEAHRQKLRIADEIHQKRMASRFYTTHKPSSGGGQNRFGAGIAERADIYMHMNALKNLASTANSLLEIGTSFRENSVAIEVFVGSAQKADSVMKEIQEFAIKSPYMFADLAGEARNMMAYGVSAEQTMDVMKSLGDIAGGNSRRFGLLSYAMSQIVSVGKLQGNELRQLTEQGFNPLKTIADKTGMSMAELFEAKEKGLITSQMVIDALKIETSEGGRFAGTMNRMSNELGGLMNRIRETIQTSILLKVYKLLEEDLKRLARRTLEYMAALEKWIDDNPELIKQIVTIARYVFVGVAAFHAAGLVIAFVVWNISALLRVLSVLRLIVMPIVLLFQVLPMVLGLIASAFTFLLSPIGLVIVAVTAIAGAFLYFSGYGGQAIDYISSKWGQMFTWFKEVFGAITTALMSGQWAAAGKIAMLAFEMAIRVLMQPVYDIWVDLYSFIAEGGVLAVTGFMSVFGSVSTTLMTGFGTAITWITGAWDLAVNAIAKKLLWLYSMFDWSIDYEEGAKMMDKEAAQRAKQRQTELDQANAKRAQDLAAANAERERFAKGMSEGIRNQANEAKDSYGNRINQLDAELKATMDEVNQKAASEPTSPEGMPVPEAYEGYDFSGLKGGKGKGAGSADLTAFTYDSGSYRSKMAEYASRVKAEGAGANPQLNAQLTANNILLKILGALTGGGTTPPDANNTISPANLNSVGA
jgi:tape measure domain-containing protein